MTQTTTTTGSLLSTITLPTQAVRDLPFRNLNADLAGALYLHLAGLVPTYAAFCIVDVNGRALRTNSSADCVTDHELAGAKAYTALTFWGDTVDFKSWNADEIDAALALNPGCYPAPGGSVVLYHGQVIGAIGVAGLGEELNHQLAASRPDGWPSA